MSIASCLASKKGPEGPSEVGVTIRRVDAHLYAGLTGSPEGEILPESPRRFFAPVAGYDILLTFEGAEAEKSSALVFSVNGVETRAVRRD
jgi:hypothetical protein